MRGTTHGALRWSQAVLLAVLLLGASIAPAAATEPRAAKGLPSLPGLESVRPARLAGPPTPWAPQPSTSAGDAAKRLGDAGSTSQQYGTRMWHAGKYEGFGGAFPNDWTLYNNPSWGDRSYLASEGNWGGYCCGSGGGSQSPPGYPNNCYGWMVYGPFSLVGANDAHVLFDRWGDTELNYDEFSAVASSDNTSWYGTSWSGNSGGWQSEELDLADLPGKISLMGRSQVWIAFVFDSDVSNCGNDKGYAGAYVDTILLQTHDAQAEDTTGPTGTFHIQNNNAYPTPYANSRQVRLDTSCQDTGSGVSRLRFRNSGQVWADWLEYSGTPILFGWALTRGEGLKTVEVEVADWSSNVSAGNDSVTYKKWHPSLHASPVRVRRGTYIHFYGSVGPTSVSKGRMAYLQIARRKGGPYYDRWPRHLSRRGEFSAYVTRYTHGKRWFRLRMPRSRYDVGYSGRIPVTWY